MDDFEKFHLRKAARTKRRPLADISTNVNKPTLHQNKTPTAKTTRQHPTKTKISHLSGISKSLNIIRPRPNTNKSAFSSKSLLFDIQSCPEPPQFEPRYKSITDNIIKRLKDTNELVSQSNSCVRAFTHWYRLQDYKFVRNDIPITSTAGRADKEKNKPGVEQSLFSAQHKSPEFSPYLVLSATCLGPYLLAVSLACIDSNAASQKDTFDVSLMNPDSRICPRQNDKILLSENGKLDIPIGDRSVPVYAVWKIVKVANMPQLTHPAEYHCA
ncbi:hypothetical protein ACI3LY_004788 [Candidozyma auris]|uniref:Uncharacterized protein n=2 Tax=Candidozyma auris TaxID=498019 RepID=A0A2H0ZF68_CANAR|nr:hypothetical protein B9J08_005519 [[Candida] auris]QWW24452.1 hypothetical protein CA7LBN_003309 [[Candida] auris]